MPDSKSIGAGLAALIPHTRRVPPAESAKSAKEQLVLQVPTDQVNPNPLQPRETFDELALEELVGSVRMHGILEPLVVTKKSDGSYELIMGERRLRAAKTAGLQRVPVIVRDDEGERRKLELAITENVQRKDLNPIERAQAYERLMRDFSLSQEDVARRVGKSREAVANALRLLFLPEPVKLLLREGKLTEGHAKVLLSIKDSSHQLMLAERIVNEHISIAGLQQLRQSTAPEHNDFFLSDADRHALEERISQSLGATVSLQAREKGGEVRIRVFSREELEHLLAKLGAIDDNT